MTEKLHAKHEDLVKAEILIRDHWFDETMLGEIQAAYEIIVEHSLYHDV